MDKKTKLVLLAILAIDLVAVILAATLGETPDRYFGEEKFMTYFSFFQLQIIYGLSIAIFIVRINSQGIKNWKMPLTWLIIAIAFIYFSLDEVKMIHEGIDRGIHKSLKIPVTGLTDRIDDIIVLFYGLGGLLFLYLFRQELRIYKKAHPFIITAFIFMFLMVFLDILTNREDILLRITNVDFVDRSYHWLKAMEDSFKIISEGIFIGAFYHCFEIARRD